MAQYIKKGIQVSVGFLPWDMGSIVDKILKTGVWYEYNRELRIYFY